MWSVLRARGRAVRDSVRSAPDQLRTSARLARQTGLLWSLTRAGVGELLRVLATHAGRTMTHAQLYTRVWDRPHGDAQQNLRVHVASVRRKLERDPVRPSIIITEPGVGYRFESGR